MERVSITDGGMPILIVAPHGPNDTNTDLLAEQIIDVTSGYGVINRGWMRGKHYDYDTEIANCNNIEHCHKEVVKDEFLNPILKYTKEIVANFGCAYMFIIHGFSNETNTKLNPKPDIIVGYGAGKKPSYSCDLGAKNLLIDLLSVDSGITIYEGAAGGRYAGRSKTNLNQLYRHWYPMNTVHSMQIEVERELREDEDIIRLTAEHIGNAIIDVMTKLHDNYQSVVKVPRC